MLMALVMSLPLIVGPPPERTSALITSDALEQLCLAPEDDADSDICVAYLAGAVDQLLLTMPEPRAGGTACPAKSPVLGDFRDAFLAYMRRHPAERQTSAASTLVVALEPMIWCSVERDER